MAGNRRLAGNVMPMAQNRRRIRSPSHPFHLRHKPFVLQPFMLAPVQAGETLKQLMYQARVVTDPLRNGLIGWWLEHYIFYVKISQTAIAPTFLYDPATLPGNAITADRLDYYQKYTAGEANVDWLGNLMKPIITYWFRNDGEDESLSTAKWSSNYIAQRVGKDVFDSVQLASALTAITDVNADLNANATITIGEIEAAWRQYDLARANGLASMSFDDYLAQQGVNLPSNTTDRARPELIRYGREWSYPTNTVEPTTGVPSSAVSWSVTGRADKDRYFKEPGFIVGITCARPKVYLKSQNGTMQGFLNSAADWLPNFLKDDQMAALERVVAASNNLDNASEIMLDFRDLFEHGEQFVNLSVDTAPGTYGMNMIATSDRQGLGRYPVEADVDAFYSGANVYVRQDGVVDLKVATQLPKDPLPGIDSMY